MKHIVTGGAGFIGSHLVDRLVADKQEVLVLDNLSGGKEEFLSQSMPHIDFVKADLLEDAIDKYFKGVNRVWHLAANPDVRILDSNVHLKQNIIATKNVLDAMEKNDVKEISFTSSSTVYGNAILSGETPVPTTESHLTHPVSFYGAAKLASEAIIEAHCSTFGTRALLFRLANVIGPRSTHGVIFDFINKLRKDPGKLEILGDGEQTKSYIHIEDCIEAMFIANEACKGKTEIFNIGNRDWINVKEIAEVVCEKMNLKPEFNFTGGTGGWKGDVPLMILDIKKLEHLGFSPKHTSRQAVEKTAEALLS